MTTHCSELGMTRATAERTCRIPIFYDSNSPSVEIIRINSFPVVMG